MPVPLERWAIELERVAAACRTITHVRVLAETASTQDVAREFRSAPGLAVVAFRQTKGRGRLGRPWADTGFEGVAVTFVVESPAGGPADRLAILSAIAAAEAVERAAGLAVGIKWPNDLVRDGRKLGGILIERLDGVALVGIGINVSQSSFPPELAAIATSLCLEGREVDRFEVLQALVASFDAALDLPTADLETRFAKRDALQGARVRVATSEGECEGVVRRIEPFRGLSIETSGGDRFCPAATTTLLSWKIDPAASR